MLPLLEAAAGLADTLAHAPGAVHEAAQGAEESSLELPNFVHILSKMGHGTPWGTFLHDYGDVVWTWVVILILSLFFFRAAKKSALHPDHHQNLAEMAVETLHDFIIGIMGKQGKEFVPFLGSLFIFIFVMNVIGLVPGFRSPTANLNTTLALALTVFAYVQYTGFRKLGPLGYLDHLAGQPRDVISWVMVPLMLPLHIVGELAKPVSLACRLFGNIFGEDVLLAVFVGLGISVLHVVHLPFGLPLQLPFIFLAILTSGVQALIFTLLSTIYLYLMLPHEQHEEHGHGHADEGLAGMLDHA